VTTDKLSGITTAGKQEALHLGARPERGAMPPGLDL